MIVTRENLWSSFVELELEVSDLKTIIQNDLDEFPLEDHYIKHFERKAAQTIADLAMLVELTKKYVDENN